MDHLNWNREPDFLEKKRGLKSKSPITYIQTTCKFSSRSTWIVLYHVQHCLPILPILLLLAFPVLHFVSLSCFEDVDKYFGIGEKNERGQETENRIEIIHALPKTLHKAIQLLQRLTTTRTITNVGS